MAIPDETPSTPSNAAVEAWFRDICRDVVREELAKLTPPAPAEPDFFEKVFALAPLSGDYVEFGVFRGTSMVRAYRAGHGWFQQLMSGRADHLVDDPAALRERIARLWAGRRFIGFDSFEGMPEPQGVDRERIIWQKGTFTTLLETFQRQLDEAGVPREKVIAVRGFFSDTLTEATRERLGITRIAVAHVDSDLYASAVLALAFVTPALQNGTVIVFGEWFAYRGHPHQGEQRAFAEWQVAHPDWLVTEYQCAGVTSKAFIVNHRTRRTPFADRLAEITE